MSLAFLDKKPSAVPLEKGRLAALPVIAYVGFGLNIATIILPIFCLISLTWLRQLAGSQLVTNADHANLKKSA